MVSVPVHKVGYQTLNFEENGILVLILSDVNSEHPISALNQINFMTRSNFLPDSLSWIKIKQRIGSGAEPSPQPACMSKR
jgi:hypothetical protein